MKLPRDISGAEPGDWRSEKRGKGKGIDKSRKTKGKEGVQEVGKEKGKNAFLSFTHLRRMQPCLILL